MHKHTHTPAVHIVCVFVCFSTLLHSQHAPHTHTLTPVEEPNAWAYLNSLLGRDLLPRHLLHLPFLKEIVSLVVDNDESGKVDNLNLPDSLHAQLSIFEYFNFLDGLLRKQCGWSADTAKVEAAVLLAGLGDLQQQEQEQTKMTTTGQNKIL